MEKRTSIRLLLTLWCTLMVASCGTLNKVIPMGSVTPPMTPEERVEADKITSARWESKPIGKGIVWKQYHFTDLFASKQYVNVLEIDTHNRLLRTDLIFTQPGFIKTSEVGAKNKAAAAINGSFFNTKTGGSVVYIKKQGKVIHAGDKEMNTYRQNGAVALGPNGVSIVPMPQGGWQVSLLPTLLSGGPLLMQGGRVLDQVQEPFNTNRHPRTAIGKTRDGKVIAVVVDGRNAQSQGVSIAELTLLMRALGCVDALNLDGGGSSTMWVEGYGIVNHPSDNKKFDHAGERAVANVLTFSYHK